MGFCYTRSGRLCCDYCGAAGAKKYRCPYGYCPPVAACEACRETKTAQFSAAFHRELGCKAAHEKFQADLSDRSAMLAAGKSLRCAAAGDNAGNVHVLFRKQDDSTVGWLMTSETYAAIPLLTNATPDDYRRHGELTEAPSTFHNGRTTKQVALA